MGQILNNLLNDLPGIVIAALVVFTIVKLTDLVHKGEE